MVTTAPISSFFSRWNHQNNPVFQIHLVFIKVIAVLAHWPQSACLRVFLSNSDRRPWKSVWLITMLAKCSWYVKNAMDISGFFYYHNGALDVKRSHNRPQLRSVCDLKGGQSLPFLYRFLFLYFLIFQNVGRFGSTPLRWKPNLRQFCHKEWLLSRQRSKMLGPSLFPEILYSF